MYNKELLQPNMPNSMGPFLINLFEKPKSMYNKELLQPNMPTWVPFDQFYLKKPKSMYNKGLLQSNMPNSMGPF